jgi:glycine cleavage system regulatory protein
VIDVADASDWSAASFRVDVNELLTRSDVEDVLGPSRRQTDQNWFRSFGEADDSLEHRLEAVTDFLVAHRHELEELASRTRLMLHISFTPREPQDNLYLSAALIEALARVSADLNIDTYIG